MLKKKRETRKIRPGNAMRNGGEVEKHGLGWGHSGESDREERMWA